MSAIALMVLGLLKAGDHIVCSQSVFGSTIKLLGGEFARFGVETTLRLADRRREWRSALRPNTRLLFAETPSNPLTEVCDIRALADIAHDAGALLAVDNCFCTPVLQLPARLGADLVIHSGTKYLDGQGRVIAGALCASEAIVEGKLVPLMRSVGMSLSPFNAWVVLKGLETLSIRMRAQSERALGSPPGSRASRRSSASTTRASPRIRSTRWRWRSSRAAAARCVSFVVAARGAAAGARRRLPRHRQHAHLLDHRQPRRHQDHRSRIRRAPRTAGSPRRSASRPASRRG